MVANKKDSELPVLAGSDITPDDKLRALDVSAVTSNEVTVAGLAQGLGLGKLVASGYGGNPTWISLSNADWADVVANGGPWIQFGYGPTSGAVVVGWGDDLAEVASNVSDNGAARTATAEWTAKSDGAVDSTSLLWQVKMNNDGTGLNNSIDFYATGHDGELYFEMTDAHAYLSVVPQAGQTSTVFKAGDVLDVGADGSVGGVTPTTGGPQVWDGTKWVASSVVVAAVPAFATPAVALGTAAAAGAASTVIRSDATILAFDATVPTTQAVGDSAATGSATVAARRDHKHAMPAFATNAVVLGSSAAAGSAATLIRSDATIAAFDGASPTTQAFGDAAAVGTAAFAARRDHKHAMPSLNQTGTVMLLPGAAILPDGSATNLAAGMSMRQGTQTGAKTHFLTLDFDGSGNVEGAHWIFRMPANYASGGTLKLSWMTNATANAVKWQAQVGAITPADADTPLEHAFAAAATVTTNVNATEARRLTESAITLTMDSAVAGDMIELFLFRDSADAADTNTADAELIVASFEYVSN